MPQIGTADVTYSTPPPPPGGAGGGAVMMGNGRIRRTIGLVFPNSANTGYPAGGVTLLPRSMGLTVQVTSLRVVARTPFAGEFNPVWTWDGNTTTPKLVGYETAAAFDTALKEITNTDVLTQSSQVLIVEVEGY